MAGPKRPAVPCLGDLVDWPSGRGWPGQVRLRLNLVEEGARMSTAISPLAPTDVPEMPAIAGVKLATAAAGIRYTGRTDVLLAVMDKGTTVAGVFTKTKSPSAPAGWCPGKLSPGGGASQVRVR